MATKAELRARLTLDKSLFDRGLASARAGVTGLSTAFGSISRFALRGFTLGAAAVAGLSAAVGVGIKKAYDLGGGLADMSAISGRSAKQILLMRRALQDAGISMEKVNRYILTGQDRGNVIGRALKNMTSKDWADAAQSVGLQADILDKNAKTFDRVSDLLGRSGDKLTGFFVGAADSVSKVLLPMLEKMDKMDFAAVGQKFGMALAQGGKILVGLFSDPKLLFGAMSSSFQAAALGMGNVLVAVFKTSVMFFQDGLLQAITGAGSAIVATLMEAFAKPIAFFQAGIEKAMEAVLPGGSVDEKFERFNIKANTAIRDSVGRTMGGDLNVVGKSAQAQIDKSTARIDGMQKSRGPQQSVAERAAEIMKDGVRAGFGEGMTSSEYRQQAREQMGAGMAKAMQAAKSFKVEDVFGAGAQATTAGSMFGKAAQRGQNVLGGLGKTAQSSAGMSWRLKGFQGMSKAYTTHPDAYTTHPDAYKSHPEAYGQTPTRSSSEEQGGTEKLTEDGMRRIMQEFWGGGE